MTRKDRTTMKIEINNHRTIAAIQQEFTTSFPGLKIAFHAKPNKSGGAPSEKLVAHSSKTIQECRVIHNEGTVEVLPTMNIAELKDIFRDVFGLSVEILQKTENGINVVPESEKLTIGQINGPPSF